LQALDREQMFVKPIYLNALMLLIRLYRQGEARSISVLVKPKANLMLK